MSFDSIGLPVTVCAPETTQLLEPGRRSAVSCNCLVMPERTQVAAKDLLFVLAATQRFGGR